MGRRYVFEQDAADPTRRARVEAAAVAAGLVPRIIETDEFVELLVDGAHDAPAMRKFESSLPASPYIVEPADNASSSKLKAEVSIEDLATLQNATTEKQKAAALDVFLGKLDGSKVRK